MVWIQRMNELFWMGEDELRQAYADLLTKLARTEQMMVMMAITIEKAVEYGYQAGYEDGITGESYSVSARASQSLVLH
jgi:hypothetical protein